jgi:hypothetical protein
VEGAYGTIKNVGFKQHVRAVAVYQLEARFNPVDAWQGGGVGVRRVLYQDAHEILSVADGHKIEPLYKTTLPILYIFFEKERLKKG